MRGTGQSPASFERRSWPRYLIATIATHVLISPKRARESVERNNEEMEDVRKSISSGSCSFISFASQLNSKSGKAQSMSLTAKLTVYSDIRHRKFISQLSM
jgi:hypothetical protein